MCVCEVSTCMWYRFSVLCDGIGDCVCVCGVAVGMGVGGRMTLPCFHYAYTINTTHPHILL